MRLSQIVGNSKVVLTVVLLFSAPIGAQFSWQNGSLGGTAACMAVWLFAMLSYTLLSWAWTRVGIRYCRMVVIRARRGDFEL